MAASGPKPKFEAAPYDFAAAAAIERALGVSHTLAQVLIRRGLHEVDEARAWLAADDVHPPSAFDGMDGAVDLVLTHVRAGTRITVHGDYDVDGICSTSILVACLRRLGATVDWFLPSRIDDGYGLSRSTVTKLTERGTRLLITVDCAITAVEEVAQARAAGLDVLVTDHHQPRADGRLPDCPVVHPLLGNYPCPDLCATAVSYKLGLAIEEAAGGKGVEDDLDLVALATIADCVPLHGENRALARAGMRAVASTAKPGLRALMRVAKVDPSDVGSHALSFRLAPRLNAAGRLYHADAGVELMLTTDESRAEEIAAELDAANAERRHVETRILFDAERQVAEQGARVSYVLAGDDWHPGVIGIVASRIAERTCRPVVMIAMDGDRGTGSGRSIPAFDLLGGLNFCATQLVRHGGHRAAAGLEINRGRVECFRKAFERHATEVLTPPDLVPTERIDAVVCGDDLGLGLAEEMRQLEPFGIGNPQPNLLVPAASLADPRPLGEEGRHTRFTLVSGSARARALAFGTPGGRLGIDAAVAADASVRLELSAWNGVVEPKVVLRTARASEPGPVDVLGEPADYLGAALADFEDAESAEGVGVDALAARPLPAERTVLDRRGRGIAGTVADLVATGEPVLVACADAGLRAQSLAGRLGGFSLCSYEALVANPGLCSGIQHVVALDPPVRIAQREAAALDGGWLHLAWGAPEIEFAHRVLHRDWDLRAALGELFRALRVTGTLAGQELESVLRRGGPPARAARLLRVLSELGLAEVDTARRGAAVPDAAPGRTELERSATYRAAQARLGEGLALLGEKPLLQAA